DEDQRALPLALDRLIGEHAAVVDRARRHVVEQQRLPGPRVDRELGPPRLDPVVEAPGLHGPDARRHREVVVAGLQPRLELPDLRDHRQQHGVGPVPPRHPRRLDPNDHANRSPTDPPTPRPAAPNTTKTRSPELTTPTPQTPSVKPKAPDHSRPHPRPSREATLRAGPRRSLATPHEGPARRVAQRAPSTQRQPKGQGHRDDHDDPGHLSSRRPNLNVP